MLFKHPKILITGVPGVGKTTMIQRILARSAAKSMAGFYTSEIRNRGVRQGFELRALNGDRQILARVDIHSRWRVGKYKVDVPGFDHFLDRLDLISIDADVVVIDEIGKMEILSHKFQRIVRNVLSSDRNVLGTIALKGVGFIQEVKRMPAVRVVEMTLANRDRLSGEILL